jgi:lipoprotein Spr
MTYMKKNRLGKTLIGISLSLSLITSGMLLNTQSAQAATVSAAPDRIISTAKSYMGKVRYHFGTRDIQHLILDCSAFTQLVFKQNGITIPWGSRAQSHVGTPVADKAHLRKGDLVMFSVSRPGRIGHVGIYIGNGKFISNTTHSGVTINDLNSGYWKNRFITGRHI